MSNNKLAAEKNKEETVTDLGKINELLTKFADFSSQQYDDKLYTLTCEDGTCIVLQKTGVNTFEAITEN